MEIYLFIFGSAFTIILALIACIYSNLNSNVKQLWHVLDEIRMEFAKLSKALVEQELSNEKRFVTKDECVKCREE